MTVEEARKHIADGQFAEGSMLPKIEAAVSFAASGPGRTTLITSLDKLLEGLAGAAGTWVVA
jgi:carbamate kinase